MHDYASVKGHGSGPGNPLRNIDAGTFVLFITGHLVQEREDWMQRKIVFGFCDGTAQWHEHKHAGEDALPGLPLPSAGLNVVFGQAGVMLCLRYDAVATRLAPLLRRLATPIQGRASEARRTRPRTRPSCPIARRWSLSSVISPGPGPA